MTKIEEYKGFMTYGILASDFKTFGGPKRVSFNTAQDLVFDFSEFVAEFDFENKFVQALTSNLKTILGILDSCSSVRI